MASETKKPIFCFYFKLIYMRLMANVSDNEVLQDKSEKFKICSEKFL